MQDFKKLQAWQKAHAVVLRTYAISASFPNAEQFGLTAQMRRASVSVPANIVEGCCRGGKRTFAQFLRIALGSAGELEYYVILASDLKLINDATGFEFATQAAEVKRVLSGLLTAVLSSDESTIEANRKLKTSN
jgi:four helix bundle protein